MANEIIAKVSLTPETVAPGQSVLIEVTGPNGESYPVSGETLVRINGIIGAQQYLQFDQSGDRAIFVAAARGGVVETTTATIHVVESDEPTPAINGDGLRIMALIRNPNFRVPPMLQIARSPRQPYAAALSLGRIIFANGFSAGPNIRQRSHQIVNADAIASGAAINQPAPISAAETTISPVTHGLLGSQLRHHMHEARADHNVAENRHFLENVIAPSRNISNLPTSEVVRHSPAVVVTPVPGGVIAEPVPQNNSNHLTFYWDFGDGTTLSTHQFLVEHDFEAALNPDAEHHLFHIKVRIEETGQPTVVVARTLYVHNAYALCKKLGTLVPRSHSTTFATQAFGGWEAAVTIDNVEPFPLVLTSRVVHPMLSEGDDLSIPGSEEILTTPVAIPPKGSVVVPVTVPMGVVPKDAIGFATTFCGTTHDGTPIRVEAHFDIAAKDRAPSGFKIGNISAGHLAGLRKAIDLWNNPVPQPDPAPIRPHTSGPATLRATLFNNMSGLTLRRSAQTVAGTLPMATRTIAQASVLDVSMRDKAPSNLGLLTQIVAPTEAGALINSSNPEFSTIIAHLAQSGLMAHSFSIQTALPPVEGAECDPDNVPNDIADDPDTDWVCQATAETRTIPTPGRFLNARKGDIVLSPGGPSLIGQLLLQVNPPQRYMHCGIMTRNYDQITHSTASENRILDYPVGSAPDPAWLDPFKTKAAPTDGHRPDVVKYCWPGVVTQNVQQALFGEEMADPEKPDKKYPISGFSREDVGMEISGNWEIIHPLVIKPDPLQEGKNPDIRKKLHDVATDALSQTGKSHYRFYCYSNAAIADDPSKFGAADAGWAAGTWPSVCSSFIWHMLKKHGVHLEGDNEFVTSSDLEEIDRAAGAQVDVNTKDGLYLYSAEERRVAANYLYHTLVSKVEKKLKEDAGLLAGSVDFFSDVKDDVANQIVNTFASDWSDKAAKDSDAWKNTSAANAVSPDNILLWDSPQLKGVYGFATPLIYREPRIETVTVSRWHKVQIKGVVFGTVRYNGQPKAGAMVQLYDGKTAFADEQGNYRLEHVPVGSYEAKASSDFGGVYLSANQPFTLNSPNMQVDIDLKPPSDLFRRLRIEATLYIFDNHLIGANSSNTEKRYAEFYLGPFGTHGETNFQVSTDEGDNISQLGVVADWNVDKSLTIHCQHAMYDDGEWVKPVDKTFNLPADYWHSWWATISNGADSSRVDVTFTNEVNPH